VLLSVFNDTRGFTYWAKGPQSLLMLKWRNFSTKRVTPRHSKWRKPGNRYFQKVVPSIIAKVWSSTGRTIRIMKDCLKSQVTNSVFKVFKIPVYVSYDVFKGLASPFWSLGKHSFAPLKFVGTIRKFCNQDEQSQDKEDGFVTTIQLFLLFLWCKK